jgi:hypothetical protein
MGKSMTSIIKLIPFTTFHKKFEEVMCKRVSNFSISNILADEKSGFKNNLPTEKPYQVSMTKPCKIYEMCVSEIFF